jgi:GNAT superfamily N-acetyltransferase
MIRFTPATAASRLDHLLARYHVNGRGMGLWVSPAATPATLPALLKARRILCRKRYPAMLKPLNGPMVKKVREPRLEIRLVDDVEAFTVTPHPMIGPLTTPRRRRGLAAMRALIAARPRRTWPFVAWLGGRAIGSSLLFMGAECAGLHDLSVLSAYRGRGFGGAILRHTCNEALARGAMVLISTSDGEPVYRRNGFDEVGRIAYWYRSFTSNTKR